MGDYTYKWDYKTGRQNGCHFWIWPDTTDEETQLITGPWPNDYGSVQPLMSDEEDKRMYTIVVWYE